MKNIVIFILVMTAASEPSFAQLVWFGKKMTVEKAEKRWGGEGFDASRFKNGGLTERSKMASSLLRNKNRWIGRPIEDIRKELGNHDGYYFTDTIPAYLITWAEKSNDEIWQIVFLPDGNYLVKDVIIEQNGS